MKRMLIRLAWLMVYAVMCISIGVLIGIEIATLK